MRRISKMRGLFDRQSFMQAAALAERRAVWRARVFFAHDCAESTPPFPLRTTTRSGGLVAERCSMGAAGGQWFGLAHGSGLGFTE
jgi:hypothetical protein